MRKVMILLTSAMQTLYAFSQDSQRITRYPSMAAKFLVHPSDIASLGMGHVHICAPTSAHAALGNPARIALTQENLLGGLSASYTPFGMGIHNAIKMITLSGYTFLSNNQYIGASIKYFTLGGIHFFDELGNEANFLVPNEWSIGAFYAKKFAEEFTMGLTIKGIYSGMNHSVTNGVIGTNSAFAIATDLGIAGIATISEEGYLHYGLEFANIGAKLSYDQQQQKAFLPMQLKLGTGYKFVFDEENNLFFAGELTKNLFPAPAIYDKNGYLLQGKDPNRDLLSALFTSFSDHPNGFKGTTKALGYAMGTELCLLDQLFFRTGYYREAQQNRRQNTLFTFGFGCKFHVGNTPLMADTAYTIPANKKTSNNNSLRIGLSISFKDG